MTLSPDITYLNDGLFVRFIPNTPEGETVWREMAKTDGVAAVFTWQLSDTLKQIRKAGYKVEIQKPSKLSVDEILAELGA